MTDKIIKTRINQIDKNIYHFDLEKAKERSFAVKIFYNREIEQMKAKRSELVSEFESETDKRKFKI